MTTLLNLRRPPHRTYTITQLCREFGVTARAMRFYEEQGLLSPARRNMARIYSYKDRARLALVVRGRNVGLSLAQIREILDIYEKHGEAAQNARALQLFQQRIEALESQRQEVDRAISTLQDACRNLSDKTPREAIVAAE